MREAHDDLRDNQSSMANSNNEMFSQHQYTIFYQKLSSKNSRLNTSLRTNVTDS